MSVKETEGVLVMEDRVDVGPSVVHKNKICKKQNKDRQRERTVHRCVGVHVSLRSYTCVCVCLCV